VVCHFKIPFLGGTHPSDTMFCELRFWRFHKYRWWWLEPWNFMTFHRLGKMY
jgi:hypothetical protein